MGNGPIKWDILPGPECWDLTMHPIRGSVHTPSLWLITKNYEAKKRKGKKRKGENEVRLCEDSL